MKILMLNPKDIHISWPVRNDFAKYLFCVSGVTFPTLSSLIPKGHDVQFFDGFYENIKIKDYLNLIKDNDVILLSITDSLVSVNFEISLKLIKSLNPNTIIVAGGIHANFYAEKWLNKGIDVIVKGEAENILPDLITNIKDKHNWHNISGLLFRNGSGEIIDTGDVSFIENLDSTPFPDWDIINFDLYDIQLTKKGYTGSIETSRGCINNCNFCLVNKYWKKSQRYKSIDRIIAELDILIRRDATQISFLDDGFANDIEREIDLFETVLCKDMKFSWGCFLRIDTIINNPDFISLASKAGLKKVVIGFEHTNPIALKKMRKGLDSISGQQVYFDAYNILKKHNIFVTGLYIAGFPGLKKEEQLKYSIARKQCSDARAGNYKPFPFSYGYKNLSPELIIDDLFYFDARLSCLKDDNKSEHFKFNILSTFDIIKYFDLFHHLYHYRAYYKTSFLLLIKQMFQITYPKVREFIIMKKRISNVEKKDYILNRYLSDEYINKLLSNLSDGN